MIAIGSDHGGYALKQEVMAFLDSKGIAYRDYGCYTEESCDYPDIAEPVCAAVVNGEAEKGILICGTGIGISMSATRSKEFVLHSARIIIRQNIPACITMRT